MRSLGDGDAARRGSSCSWRDVSRLALAHDSDFRILHHNVAVRFRCNVVVSRGWKSRSSWQWESECVGGRAGSFGFFRLSGQVVWQ